MAEGVGKSEWAHMKVRPNARRPSAPRPVLFLAGLGKMGLVSLPCGLQRPWRASHSAPFETLAPGEVPGMCHFSSSPLGFFGERGCVSFPILHPPTVDPCRSLSSLLPSSFSRAYLNGVD